MVSHDISARCSRKRVTKACQRCKCSGDAPCESCKATNAVCTYREGKPKRHRVFTQSYVQLIEDQRDLLVRGLRELYQRTVTGGSIKRIASDRPLSVNDILYNLGIYDAPTEDSPKTPPTPLQLREECTEKEDERKDRYPDTIQPNTDVQSCPNQWYGDTGSVFSDFLYSPSSFSFSPSISSLPDCPTYMSSVITPDVGPPFQMNPSSCMIAEGNTTYSGALDQQKTEADGLQIVSEDVSTTADGNILSPWAMYRIALNAPNSALYEPLGTAF
ncbi:hypothetical protein ASPACDRAFT_47454 [Aspergillus aculeatus ATCC 16872]|uniref:Zn(2)-C6 fungal-type domain-containing protein n=1 Tax=Aspergillus aculeatus (strain ATCC 16872 / CBS 172.66 / WB 5094) TaxID=690307 RepID=A0A1L9WIX4_ASPA1|nr:uncharacterized protein ASPACDRAFT_47454 [Aspergillus aculeatus ATCC 16872]OJJ96099.1 hypothetical protein ASPACDRAFT_47454 [Aspergillus aculeatus ATCC 16872]